MHISISIVLFNTEKRIYQKIIKSIINSKIDKAVIYVIDNSSKENKSAIFKQSGITYIHNKKNIGYGSAHNLAIKHSNCQFHLIVNPDIFFKADSLKKLILIMKKNPEYSAIMPKIKFPNGENQNLYRLLPSPLDLIKRRFIPELIKKITSQNQNKIENKTNRHLIVPFLSGCFILCRTSSLKKINGFDKRFFLYMEDTDLSRRLFNEGKTIYVPEVTVYHAFQRNSYKKLNHLIYHISSAIKYFNKWGWFFDRERNKINKIAQSINIS